MPSGAEAGRGAFHTSATALARAGKPPGQSQQHEMDDGRAETTRPPSPMEEEGGSGAEEDDGQGRHEFSLPPTDSGKDAWLFLLASFMMEAFVWGACSPINIQGAPYVLTIGCDLGFPFAFGVFQNYYSTHEPFAGSSQIAVIGTCAMVRTPLRAATKACIPQNTDLFSLSLSLFV